MLRVPCYDSLFVNSNNHHFYNNNKCTEPSLTGRSVINEQIADSYIGCENKESSCIGKESSFQSWKKKKSIRNLESGNIMSFKSFAEQYSMYAASVAGKEDLENLRNLVRSKTHDNNSQEGSRLSSLEILNKRKSIGFVEEENDAEKNIQPVCNNSMHIDNMRTDSPAAVNIILRMPLSGIKNLPSTPEFLLETSQMETKTRKRNSADAVNNFECNGPRPVFESK